MHTFQHIKKAINMHNIFITSFINTCKTEFTLRTNIIYIKNKKVSYKNKIPDFRLYA